jgi:hypothetical protein
MRHEAIEEATNIEEAISMDEAINRRGRLAGNLGMPLHRTDR